MGRIDHQPGGVLKGIPSQAINFRPGFNVFFSDFGHIDIPPRVLAERAPRCRPVWSES
jgi:hypothetical protein